MCIIIQFEGTVVNTENRGKIYGKIYSQNECKTEKQLHISQQILHHSNLFSGLVVSQP